MDVLSCADHAFGCLADCVVVFDWSAFVGVLRRMVEGDRFDCFFHWSPAGQDGLITPLIDSLKIQTLTCSFPSVHYISSKDSQK